VPDISEAKAVQSFHPQILILTKNRVGTKNQPGINFFSTKPHLRKYLIHNRFAFNGRCAGMDVHQGFV